MKSPEIILSRFLAAYRPGESLDGRVVGIGTFALAPGRRRIRLPVVHRPVAKARSVALEEDWTRKSSS
jgi:hypothetical protein